MFLHKTTIAIMLEKLSDPTFKYLSLLKFKRNGLPWYIHTWIFDMQDFFLAIVIEQCTTSRIFSHRKCR